MEIAKFVFTAIGTFLSVLALSFSVFQYWKKKQDEKIEQVKVETKEQLASETTLRKQDVQRIEKKLDSLESTLVQSMQQRMSAIEGELKGMKPILQSIQNWFINNTPRGQL